MRRNSKRVARMICAVSASAAASQVLGNSGIQLPLSQYQAGQEQTVPVTNGGFEADGVGNLATPTGWTRIGTEMYVDPVYSAPPLNPSAIGSFSAQTRGSGATSYTQSLSSLAAGQNYVLSAYVWNSGRFDPSGLAAGDLATVRVVDPANPFSNISMALEATGTNSLPGSTGRLMYMLFNQADVAAWSGVDVELISETGTIGGALPNPWAQYDNIAVTPAQNFLAQKWLNNVSGNWNDDSKWLGGVNPNQQQSPFFVTSKGAIASFTNGITSDQTITVNVARTVAVMNFDNATAKYTLAGPSTLSLDVTADGFGATQGVPEINVLSGNHTINAPVTLLRKSVLNVVPAGGTLTLTGTLNAGPGVVKRGAGLATVPRIRAGSQSVLSLSVEGGTLRVAPSSLAAGVSRITAVSVSAGAKFDLSDNKLITATAIGSHNGTNYTGILGLVESGRNGGVWNGPGITTSMTAATSGSGYTMLGVATGSEARGIGPAATDTWAGLTVTGTDTLVMYTYGGDANLSGNVDIDDYGQIDFNASTGGVLTGWYNGDFDYNGIQDIDDYGVIDFVVGIQGSPFFTGDGAGLSAAAVPEPGAALGITTLAGLALRRRRNAR